MNRPSLVPQPPPQVPLTSSTILSTRIQQVIEADGPITFLQFMQMALYEHGLGYYRTTRQRFGPEGDFYTAEQLTPFADAIATYLRRYCHQQATVLELGAGRADLAAALKDWNYQPYDWNTPDLPASIEGLILANEFFDALPVTVLRKRGTHWRELLIGFTDDRFAWTVDREPSESLRSYADRYGAALPNGGLLEIAPSLLDWIARIATVLQRGRVLIFDYGYDANELIRLHGGTLLAYRKHMALDDVLNLPGECDITAHVNFTALLDSAEGAGLRLISATSLQNWVLAQWSPEELEQQWTKWSPKQRLQWKMLVVGMGESFRVLELEKSP